MINILNKVKTHQVEVQITYPFLNLFLSSLYRLHINIKDIKYLDSNTIVFTTTKENIKLIKNNFKDAKIIIIKDKGLYKIKPLILKNKIFLTCLFGAIILFFLLQNIIVRVDVIHSDKIIRELVTEELAENGIKRLTFKKSYQQLQKIKQKILDKYPDKLEWIEIESKGMSYQIRIEERIITRPKENNKLCNIVASQSAIVTKVISKKGLNLKQPGDYVSKGDIIIAGDITANEEVKQRVCAEGEVYGEVWYQVNVSIPLNYEQKVKTGKKRINFMYDNGKEKKSIFKSRFKNKKIENKKIFSLFGITFYKQTEYELKITKKKYTKKEALDEALKKASEKIQIQLNDKERIITQKVLNNNQKDSKISVEIFTSVEKQIASIVNYEAQEESLE